MTHCDQCGPKVLRYLDNDLSSKELDDFRTHIESCADCRADLQAEQALSQLLYRTRPLYRAPLAFRLRLCVTLLEHCPFWRKLKAFREHVSHVLETKLANSARCLSLVRLPAAALFVMGLLLVIVPKAVREARAANFVETAISAHRSYLNGNLPLGTRANSPDLVTAWFADKVPFQFRLPNAQSATDTISAYELTGAGLVSDRGAVAALVIYQRQDQKLAWWWSQATVP